jgi:RNA recognition motif-containing protein
VTGLPKTYERKDVKRFFTGCNVTNRPGGIFIETDTLNGPTFVEFETEIDAEKAFFYNGEQMGKIKKTKSFFFQSKFSFVQVQQPLKCIV